MGPALFCSVQGAYDELAIHAMRVDASQRQPPTINQLPRLPNRQPARRRTPHIHTCRMRMMSLSSMCVSGTVLLMDCPPVLRLRK